MALRCQCVQGTKYGPLAAPALLRNGRDLWEAETCTVRVRGDHFEYGALCDRRDAALARFGSNAGKGFKRELTYGAFERGCLWHG
jgi:hypothetical protein